MNISENYILAKPQSSILNSTSDQVEQKISRNHSDYLTILKENNLLDDNQFIKEYLFTNSSIPPLNQEEVKFIQGILDKQLLVQGRSLKFPLNLNFTLRKLLNEFNDYPISFFGSRLWNSLGLGYMERVFENGFHDKKLNIPTKDLISPLIQSKTHKKSDFDINIFIPSLSDLKKFNQFLLDKFPKLKWDKVMNYLSMRQARAKTKELGNYERQLLENVNLTDLSDSELFEIYLNITCFESASNVKEEHKEFYYRSFKTETDEGLTLDITFIVDIHQTFAFIYQGLYLELNPFLKVDLPYVTPKSYYPNIFQVIHHNNAGIIAPYENFENFDERELKIFLAALRVGFNRINSKLERKITNNLEFFELCSKVLTSKSSEFLLIDFLNCCSFFPHFLLDKLPQLQSQICPLLKTHTQNSPFLNSIIQVLPLTTSPELFIIIKIFIGFYLSQKTSVEVFDIVYDTFPFSVRYKDFQKNGTSQNFSLRFFNLQSLSYIADRANLINGFALFAKALSLRMNQSSLLENHPKVYHHTLTILEELEAIPFFKFQKLIFALAQGFEASKFNELCALIFENCVNNWERSILEILTKQLTDLFEDFFPKDLNHAWAQLLNHWSQPKHLLFPYQMEVLYHLCHFAKGQAFFLDIGKLFKMSYLELDFEGKYLFRLLKIVPSHQITSFILLSNSIYQDPLIKLRLLSGYILLKKDYGLIKHEFVKLLSSSFAHDSLQPYKEGLKNALLEIFNLIPIEDTHQLTHLFKFIKHHFFFDEIKIPPSFIPHFTHFLIEIKDAEYFKHSFSDKISLIINNFSCYQHCYEFLVKILINYFENLNFSVVISFTDKDYQNIIHYLALLKRMNVAEYSTIGENLVFLLSKKGYFLENLNNIHWLNFHLKILAKFPQLFSEEYLSKLLKVLEKLIFKSEEINNFPLLTKICSHLNLSSSQLIELHYLFLLKRLPWKIDQELFLQNLLFYLSGTGHHFKMLEEILNHFDRWIEEDVILPFARRHGYFISIANFYEDNKNFTKLVYYCDKESLHLRRSLGFYRSQVFMKRLLDLASHSQHTLALKLGLCFSCNSDEYSEDFIHNWKSTIAILMKNYQYNVALELMIHHKALTAECFVTDLTFYEKCRKCVLNQAVSKTSIDLAFKFLVNFIPLESPFWLVYATHIANAKKCSQDLHFLKLLLNQCCANYTEILMDCWSCVFNRYFKGQSFDSFDGLFEDMTLWHKFYENIYSEQSRFFLTKALIFVAVNYKNENPKILKLIIDKFLTFEPMSTFFTENYLSILLPLSQLLFLSQDLNHYQKGLHILRNTRPEKFTDLESHEYTKSIYHAFISFKRVVKEDKETQKDFLKIAQNTVNYYSSSEFYWLELLENLAYLKVDKDVILKQFLLKLLQFAKTADIKPYHQRYFLKLFKEIVYQPSFENCIHRILNHPHLSHWLSAEARLSYESLRLKKPTTPFLGKIYQSVFVKTSDNPPHKDHFLIIWKNMFIKLIIFMVITKFYEWISSKNTDKDTA